MCHITQYIICILYSDHVLLRVIQNKDMSATLTIFCFYPWSLFLEYRLFSLQKSRSCVSPTDNECLLHVLYFFSEGLYVLCILCSILLILIQQLKYFWFCEIYMTWRRNVCWKRTLLYILGTSYDWKGEIDAESITLLHMPISVHSRN
jgi:hypothetical protein